MEYSNFGFEIFSMPADAQIHSLGGSPKQESMSLNNLPATTPKAEPLVKACQGKA